MQPFYQMAEEKVKKTFTGMTGSHSDSYGSESGPSKLRKIKQLRNLKSEKEQRQKDKETNLAVYDSVTKKLAEHILLDLNREF